MKSVVKIVTNKPGAAPKAVEYAQIDNQGRIPYGDRGCKGSSQHESCNGSWHGRCRKGWRLQ